MLGIRNRLPLAAALLVTGLLSLTMLAGATGCSGGSLPELTSAASATSPSGNRGIPTASATLRNGSSSRPTADVGPSPAAQNGPPVGKYPAAAIKVELKNRSFRQFDPHIDGNPRKAVVLDFFRPFFLWAQYSEDGWATDEWGIDAGDYRVESGGSATVVTLYPVTPQTWRGLPTECNDCIDVTGLQSR